MSKYQKYRVIIIFLFLLVDYYTLKKFNHYEAFKSSKQSIVTIGTFDGVHIGHQKILKELVTHAKKKNLYSVLLTFFPHPRMVLQEKNSIKLIHTIEERIKLIKSTGINAIIVHPFDNSFASLTAFDFVKKVLVEHLNTKKLVIGYDHRFGKNREGTFEQLEEYGRMFDFQIIEISAQNVNEITVSSTKIRKAILQGAIQKANTYLSKPFSLRGLVIKGRQIGQKIGFPTANIKVEEDYKILPKNGVYKVQSFIDNVSFLGMLNLGFRPTLQGKKQTIEVHFFNLNKDLYGKELTIYFLEFIRNERKFANLEKLKQQLQKDVQIISP